MGKIENLRPPWKKGESGNPNGRPKRKPITQAYEAVINQRLPAHLREIKLGRHTLELPEGATFADLIALGQAAAAIKGNTAAAEEIANRLEGKVAMELDVVAGTSLGERIHAARMRLERRSGEDDESKVDNVHIGPGNSEDNPSTGNGQPA